MSDEPENDEPADLDDLDTLEAMLEDLLSRHRVLDERISALMESGEAPFQVMTLKREKLRLKDKITWVSTKLTPNIIA